MCRTHAIHAPETRDRLPPEAAVWSVSVAGKDLNYGQIHEMIHRDISIGNDYRKERIKLMTASATGVFALTVTFHKDLFGNGLNRTEYWLLMLGWGMLISSLLAGIVHFGKWEDFYLEHRARANAIWRYHTAADQSGRGAACAAYFKSSHKIDEIRRSYKRINLTQSATLVLGLIFVAVYVASTGFQVSGRESNQTTKHTSVPAAPAGATSSKEKNP